MNGAKWNSRNMKKGLNYSPIFSNFHSFIFLFLSHSLHGASFNYLMEIQHHHHLIHQPFLPIFSWVFVIVFIPFVSFTIIASNHHIRIRLHQQVEMKISRFVMWLFFRKLFVGFWRRVGWGIWDDLSFYLIFKALVMHQEFLCSKAAQFT